MKIIFDVMHLYYLPQYLPVADELLRRGHDVSFLFHKNADTTLNGICEKVIKSNDLTADWVDSTEMATSYYLEQGADWIVFGNAVSDNDKIQTVSKTALMQHGIGPKSCYYDVSEQQTTVRFIEGQHRLKRLETLYPNGKFEDTGYAKLDPIINDEPFAISIESLGLDPNKPTLLYAPTFYPSSIEKFSKYFSQDFAEFNIILKPHFFSLTKRKYAKQRKLLEHWAKAPNVYLAKIEDFNLVPFMALADVMLSDASSAIFEFAALEKPVVWCDFYQLRWSYRGPLKYRFTKRLDTDIGYFEKVANRADNYASLSASVAQALGQKTKPESKTIIQQLVGQVDGKSAIRIADYLVNN